MGKDDKEDSGFGFKDKAKALETLRLLEAHDPNYRRLTVRGLLGRAKRVLSMTKAEDKIKNIKEAMEVFENWLAELADQKNNKTDKEEKKSSREDKKKKSDSDSSSSSSDVEMEEKKEKDKPEKSEKQPLPSDSVPGLGFKDAEAARGSLTELRGRDPDYQRLAVKGLIGRAKRVLTCTRDETKISNIKEAMEVFEKFLDEFESLHLSRQNNPYVSLGIVRTAQKKAGDSVSEQQTAFIAAYASVRGEYKRLRTVTATDSDKTWDIVRNTALSELKEKYADAKLFNEKDEPTPEHIQMLLWAYSPEAARAKKYIPETKEERDKDSDRKRRHSDKEADSSDRKRRSSGRDDESPSKRSKE